MEASDGVAVEQSRARGWALMWISVQDVLVNEAVVGAHCRRALVRRRH